MVGRYAIKYKFDLSSIMCSLRYRTRQDFRGPEIRRKKSGAKFRPIILDMGKPSLPPLKLWGDSFYLFITQRGLGC